MMSLHVDAGDDGLRTPKSTKSNKNRIDTSPENIQQILKKLQKQKLHYQLTGQYELAEITVDKIEKVKKEIADQNKQNLQNNNERRIRRVCTYAPQYIYIYT